MNTKKVINSEDYFQKLHLIVDGLNRKYPGGNAPFQLITRLCEEAGELAKVVNHFEGTGIKLKKYGDPDKKHLAKEVQDVLRTALAVAKYYGIDKELESSIDVSYDKLVDDGFISQT